jgi:uncharacterized protein YqjF (DUF2071 family)
MQYQEFKDIKLSSGVPADQQAGRVEPAAELSGATVQRNVRQISRTLSTNWENLVVLNFDVDPSLLKPYLPRGTEVDTFAGNAKLSLVGFEFRRSRMCGLTSPKLFDFAEINLRTYVKSETDGTPGVIFIKELCPSRLACLVARFLFNESFERCPTSCSKEIAGGGRSVRYEWGAGGSASFVQLRSGAAYSAMTPGSEEAFVGARQFGFSRMKDGSTLKFEVLHRPWKIAPALDLDFQIMGEKFYGKDLAEAINSKPTSAFLMDGSSVDVLKHYS